MKQVTDAFKTEIKKMGRQIDLIIEYTENNVHKIIDNTSIICANQICNGNLLKSLMKEFDFESTIKVSKDTVIEVRFGVLINKGYTVQQVHQMRVNRLNNTEVKYLQGFDYCYLGKFIVIEEPEYNADTNTYSHKCYDKMIYAMQQNEELDIAYPISIKEYLKAICKKLEFAYKDTIFANQNNNIEKELYVGLEYTYRDILDEIAQASGSIIVIKQDDELEVKYPYNTQVTINGEYMKDINVALKEKYGPINSIVLSRSAESDNVYIQDEESIEENGLCELKIVDNQIMNWEDREDYLQPLLTKLDGISYYINDYNSTGITFLEIGDKYNMQIDNNIYPCLMLNDEINVTQGLTETIFTEMPEQSETDYSKADKTDRKFKKINNAIIEINKQEAKINLEVSKKLDKDKFTSAEIIMAINGDESSTEIHADKVSLTGKEIDLTADNVKIASDHFNVDKYGNVDIKNGIIEVEDNGLGGYEGKIRAIGNNFICGSYSDGIVIRKRNSPTDSISANSIFLIMYDGKPRFELTADTTTTLRVDERYFAYMSDYEKGFSCDRNGNIYADGTITPSSLEEKKKNFEKLQNGLNIIKDIDIYKYNFKTENDNDKKHIGFVIGKDFKYNKEITSNNNDGVDLYSFISVCCKAIQELNTKVENLENKIKEMEGNK